MITIFTKFTNIKTNKKYYSYDIDDNDNKIDSHPTPANFDF